MQLNTLMFGGILALRCVDFHNRNGTKHLFSGVVIKIDFTQNTEPHTRLIHRLGNGLSGLILEIVVDADGAGEVGHIKGYDRSSPFVNVPMVHGKNLALHNHTFILTIQRNILHLAFFAAEGLAVNHVGSRVLCGRSRSRSRHSRNGLHCFLSHLLCLRKQFLLAQFIAANHGYFRLDSEPVK